MKTCKAITNQGTQCSRLAKENGYCKQHSPEKEQVSFSYKNWEFKAPYVAKEKKSHFITVSAFTFEKAYRDSTKYAEGTPKLVEFVKEYMPDFGIRFYYDNSIVPEEMKKRGRKEEAEAWQLCFDYLATQDIVQPIWFRHKKHSTNAGHIELFSMLVRFLPMFDYDFPEWMETPPNGSVVYDCDIDFKFNDVEIINAYAANWLEKQKDIDVFEFSIKFSELPRQQPDAGLPPLSGARFITKTRLPESLFEDFIDNPDSYLLEHYLEDVKNSKSERNKIITQKLFPYGIDELFLANVVKLYCLTSEKPYRFFFLLHPKFHAKFTQQILDNLQETLTENPNYISHPIVVSILKSFSNLAKRKISSVSDLKKNKNVIRAIDESFTKMYNDSFISNHSKGLAKQYSIHYRDILESFLQGTYKDIFTYDTYLIKFCIEEISFLTESFPQLLECVSYVVGKGAISQEFDTPEINSLTQFLEKEFKIEAV